MQPPKKALRFLRWFCREDYLDEIEGDLIELFEKRAEESPPKAKRRFIWDVIKSLRLRNMRSAFSHSNQIGMYKNYIKIAFRVFQREKSFTGINVLGLALGLAISLLIIQYARFEFSYETMYPKADRILRVTTDYMDGETLAEQDCEVYPPVGIELKARYPEVEDFTRAYEVDQTTIQLGDQQHYIETIYAVDSMFFSIFDTRLVHGNPNGIFGKPHELVLTESTAKRIFNRVDVVGEMVKVPLNSQTVSMKVVGIVKDSPTNTHLKFDVLMSYPTMITDFGEREDNWNGNNTYLYVLLSPNTSFEVFEKQLVNFNQQARSEEKLENERMVAEKITDIHLYSNKSFEPETNGNAISVYFLLGVAMLIIISAFVNYINLSTSKALDRAKEVGIRKVVGSTRGQLAAQFLIESALVNLIAATSAVLFILIVTPWFIGLAGLPFDFVIFNDSNFWLLLVALVVLGIVLSGVYPALVLSSFKPVTVMKGKFGNYGKGVAFRKGLVVFQFAITILLLVQTFTVYLQLDFIKKMDLGLNVDQTLVVQAPAQDSLRQKYSIFKDKMLLYSQVKSVSRSESVPGLPSSYLSTTTSINPVDAIEEHSYNYYINRIDEDFIDLMNIELLTGENFKKTSNSENREVIVNEEAIRLWNIPTPEQAIGKKLDYWGKHWTIVGVVKNYRQESPKSPFIPILHKYSSWYSSYASIKFESGHPSDNLAQVREVYESAFPNAPFEYFFLDQEYDKQFRADQQFQQVFTVITGFAILIACLGLFGLASFTVAKRAKEIGIRKVIGASTANILVLLSSDFMKTVLISAVVGIPITYWLVNNWLDNFATRISVSWWMFALPTSLVLILALASMSFKTIKVALSNPVDSLRDE